MRYPLPRVTRGVRDTPVILKNYLLDMLLQANNNDDVVKLLCNNLQVDILFIM